ncbi:hypothetical protein Vi05172_g2498 [Venturia inaequalis]|nr:hypothetical protein Vi05172_g2498 [Venturia inaequalis]
MHDLEILASTYTNEPQTIIPISENPPQPPARPNRLLIYRSLIIWFTTSVILLLFFLLFVRYGWPGSPDPCTTTEPTDTCWCEAFEPSDIGTPGVRQAANTWSNLYALFTSLLVAIVVCLDRQKARDSPQNSGSKNLIRGSNTWVADLYVFVVSFLGLGNLEDKENAYRELNLMVLVGRIRICFGGGCVVGPVPNWEASVQSDKPLSTARHDMASAGWGGCGFVILLLAWR